MRTRIPVFGLPKMLINKIIKRWGVTLVMIGVTWGVLVVLSNNYGIRGSMKVSVQYTGVPKDQESQVEGLLGLETLEEKTEQETDQGTQVMQEQKAVQHTELKKEQGTELEKERGKKELSTELKTQAPEVIETDNDGNPPKFNGPTFLIVMCRGRRSGKEGTMRQIRQAGMMFKSALTFAKRRLRFFISTDSKDIREELEKLVNSWPEPYRSKLVLKFVSVWKPPMESRMWSLGVECVMQRLFVPDMIPNEDAVIYSDTDMIFMRDPDDLWSEFNKFNSTQLAAMGPCLYYYGTAKNSKSPFYGTSGLNAGLILMNLTRMRTSFPEGGWLEANMAAFDEYREIIALADQDIINIVFAKHPHLMYELGCEWNYRPWQCKLGKNTCPKTSFEGVSLIHGNTKAFVNGKETKMMAVFEAWKQYELGGSMVDLYHNMTKLLSLATVQGYKWECAKLDNVDVILSQRLKSYLIKSGLIR